MGSVRMFNGKALLSGRVIWPAVTTLALFVLTAFLLRTQGRLWICACGTVRLWAGDIWSSDNSQHLLDPYSFTHIEHGILLYWLLAWLLPRLSLAWRFIVALGVESAWEIVENSEAVIQRYREATLALGYQGDTVVNAFSDIALCGAGFLLAHYLGFWRTLVLLVLLEIGLVLWIRDSLLLNIIMLIYPTEAIRVWQMGM